MGADTVNSAPLMCVMFKYTREDIPHCPAVIAFLKDRMSQRVSFISQSATDWHGSWSWHRSFNWEGCECFNIAFNYHGGDLPLHGLEVWSEDHGNTFSGVDYAGRRIRMVLLAGFCW